MSGLKKLKYSVLKQTLLEKFGHHDGVTEESQGFLDRQAVRCARWAGQCYTRSH